jgi:hypothetical protein
MQGSRCESCQHAHIIVGYRESETIVYCNYVYEQAIPVPFRVRECSNYSDKNKPTWEQMKDLALPLREGTSAKTTGFTVPILLPEAEDEEEVAVTK